MEVLPERIQPGGRMIIKGQGFGETPALVSISARPLIIEQWGDREIIVQAPTDTPRGDRFLVVSRLGQQTSPFPVFVVGDLESRPRGGRPELGVIPDLNPMPDGGPLDLSVDMIISDQDMGQTLSLTLDDLQAEVILEAEIRNFQGVDELWLHVIARDPNSLGRESGWDQTPLWGAASQLDFPVSQLRFIRMELPDGPKAAALLGERDGRIYWYHGGLEIPSGATRFTLMSLRFERLNPQEKASIRFSFVPRHSSLRGVKNQGVPGRWSGGELQLEGTGDAP